MNPGLLNQRVRFQRQAAAVDELGQPVEVWTDVGGCFARRKLVATQRKTETVVADRATETREVRFQMRSRPFVTIYREGDRLMELARTDFPETAWKITGWTEVEGTGGMYVEVTVEVA